MRGLFPLYIVPRGFGYNFRVPVSRLREFFHRIPAEDKMCIREDVDSRDVVKRWADNLDCGSAFPILALDGDRVVGDTTLHRNRTGWKRRVGVIRIRVESDYRHRGPGAAMLREIRYAGEKTALRHIVAEAVEERQGAIRALEKQGFERAVAYRNYVNDRKGGLRNPVILLYSMRSADEETGF